MDVHMQFVEYPVILYRVVITRVSRLLSRSLAVTVSNFGNLVFQSILSADLVH